MVDTALEFFGVQLFQKDTLVVHTAIATLHTFTLDIVGHLVDAAQYIVKEMHCRTLTQCADMRLHLSQPFAKYSTLKRRFAKSRLASKGITGRHKYKKRM